MARTFLRACLLSLAAMAAPTAWAQAMPADDVSLPDYLDLLGRIAPAAREGAQAYAEAFQARCGRPLRTTELRVAVSQGDGDPVLMGMIRATHMRDEATLRRLAASIQCPRR
jgi:hypothetical protein